jgi:5-(carboxyamino)imidazole ribonucleotide mutase
MKIIILSGSDKDAEHIAKLQEACNEFQIPHEWIVASAHKTPRKALEVLETNEANAVVYITVAGMSNALSGFCAANTKNPVIACPPFSDKIDMMVNIQSTLQMPSNVPAMTVLNPRNAILAAKYIFDLAKKS